MIVAIVGSRDFTDYTLLKATLAKVKSPITGIVSGGARGADALGGRYAREHEIPLTEFPAQWKRADGSTDRGAGMRRNTDIVNAAEALVAFWDGESRGTADSLNKAIERGIPKYIVYYKGRPANVDEHGMPLTRRY